MPTARHREKEVGMKVTLEIETHADRELVHEMVSELERALLAFFQVDTVATRIEETPAERLLNAQG
jgi:hypothetical protein